MSKSALFLIDAQNDFCVTPEVAKQNGYTKSGTLSVDGAWEDMQRVATFIRNNDLDAIILTQDSHHVIDISHPSFWMKSDGSPVDVFSTITTADINSGKYTARFNPIEANKYIAELEANGEFVHCIWPPHCIIGSFGAAIVDPIMDSVMEWCAKNRRFHTIIQKGEYPLSEHFGALRANVPNLMVPATLVNQKLIQILMSYNDVYLAGEARSHCVANTLKQLMTEAPALLSKIIVLEDCMSDVFSGGNGWPAAEKIYSDAKNLGVKFQKSI